MNAGVSFLGWPSGSQPNRLARFPELLAIVVLLACAPAYAVEPNAAAGPLATKDISQPMGAVHESADRPPRGVFPRLGARIFGFFRGRPIPDGVMILPFGMHSGDPLSNATTTDFNYVSITHNSFNFGTFVNSFGDRTWLLSYGRNVISGKRLGVDLFGGVMVGYDGNLANSDLVPDFLRPVFEGNVNPIVGLSAYYRVSEAFELRALTAGRSILLGVKYNF